MEELGLPEVVDLRGWKDYWGRWTAAPALKLVRSHLVSPGAPLMHVPHLHVFATHAVYLRTSFGATGTLPHDLGHELTELLLEGDPGLETFAILAAGLPGVKKSCGWEAGECEIP